MELLAPAGEKEIALAALRAGADACYVGGLWSARAYAKNFDERDLLDTLDFAHAHGKKVYVALNTMLDTRELADALSYTGRLYDAGVDAIIAADLGYIAEAHTRFPGLALHASTQAGVQSAAGAALLQSLGCTRVVAARECTMADLRAMAQAGIEVEAFCHGAMCSGVSGACLLSGVLGGRSGNRGRCAQPCRQEYRLLGEKGYFLSMKDLCTLDLIAAFDRAGVCSLKIEGRMKKLEYVTSAVAAYRRAMDAYAVGRRADTAALRRELSVMFNRGGFSEGYLLGSRDVTYVKKPNHRGLYLGKIADIRGGRGFVRTDWPLQKGDSVEVGTQGFALAYADREGDGFRIAVPRGAAVGQPVYLKASLALLQKAQAAEQGQADFCETAVTLPVFRRGGRHGMPGGERRRRDRAGGSAGAGTGAKASGPRSHPAAAVQDGGTSRAHHGLPGGACGRAVSARFAAERPAAGGARGAAWGTVPSKETACAPGGGKAAAAHRVGQATPLCRGAGAHAGAGARGGRGGGRPPLCRAGRRGGTARHPFGRVAVPHMAGAAAVF